MNLESLIADRYRVSEIHGHGDGATFASATDTSNGRTVIALMRHGGASSSSHIAGVLAPVRTARWESNDVLIYEGIVRLMCAWPAPWPPVMLAQIEKLLQRANDSLADSGLELSHAALRHLAIDRLGVPVLLDPPCTPTPVPGGENPLRWLVHNQSSKAKHWGAYTDTGPARVVNEDTWAVAHHLSGSLWVCADGMSGFQGGEFGIRLALMGAVRVLPCADPVGEVLRAANQELRDLAEQHPTYMGVAGAAVAVWVLHGTAQVGWVGDCRAWLLRRSALTQLTKDHSLVNKMIEQGKLTPAEAEDHPHSNVLLRALGVEDTVDISRVKVPLQPGDRLILATDGVHKGLEREEMREICMGQQPPEVSRALVRAGGNAQGDNGAAVVIDIR